MIKEAMKALIIQDKSFKFIQYGLYLQLTLKFFNIRKCLITENSIYFKIFDWNINPS